MKYLKLIRFQNLIMIIVAQCVVKFGFFLPFDVEIYLSNLGFVFLVLATTLIAAGGYVINDFFDETTDKINKPKKRIVGVSVSHKKAKLLYYILTFTGVGFGFILSNMISRPSYFIIFVLTAFALYLYARILRRIGLVGNILVSLLVALSLLIIGIFELIPIVDEYNRDDQLFIFNILKDLAIFAFAINLIRELVKDIEDIQGDHVARYKTLPVILGAQRTARLTAIIGLIALTMISWYTFTFLYERKLAVAIVFFGIVAPLGYVATQLWEADKKSQFTKISLLLKIIMFIGICSIPLITYTIQNAD